MSFLKEFREFAMRGNVVDLAVGVIIGAAFGKIVSSLVADIIMPPLGLLIGGIDFKQFAVTLRDTFFFCCSRSYAFSAIVADLSLRNSYDSDAFQSHWLLS